jgi:processive 1,2-diacylglycerol beta-glucosyltransferase
MGAGHDGAARELVRRLQADGHQAEMRDFMASAPFKIGDAVKASYEFQMKHFAWTYDLTYRLWYLLPFLLPPVGRFMAWLTRRRLLRWILEYQADVVVSTYPLASVVLGQLRTSGRLDIPAVNFITDFGVHPLWVHRGIDLNLAVHPDPAAEAATKSGRPALATGPMVSSRFSEPQDRAAARAALTLGPEERAVLIVAGSWGVGDVAKTFRTIAASGRFVPVAVCGRDERLRQKLSRIPGGRALGWTDRMPALMAAADALVENAGGLTAMEALAVGLPVISFKPIAGHGKENTAEMQQAGVSRVAKKPADLLRLLDVVTQPGPTKQAMVEAGKAMFVANAADHVLEAAAAGVPQVTPISAWAPRRPSVAVARIAAAIAAVPLLWAGITTGVGVVTAYGAGVAHPQRNVGNVAYIGVRLNAAELLDPAIQQQVADLHATAVLDQQTAQVQPAAVQQLVSRGVDVENGGRGQRFDREGHLVGQAPWQRARGDVRASQLLQQISGEPVKVFVPGRRVNAFDLVESYSAHTRTVVPDRVFEPADIDQPMRLTARQVYLINGVRSTPIEVEDLLTLVSARLSVAQLVGAPLVELR